MKRFLVVIVALLSSLALAHDTSLSSIKVLLDKTSATISVQTNLSKVGKQDALPGLIKMTINGHPWSPINPDFMVDQKADIIVMQAKVDEAIEGFEVQERLFAKDPNAKTIVTVMRDGESVGDAVVTNEFPSWKFGKETKASVLTTIKDFMLMGIEHILTGPDHLLFIFGLMLARPRIKELIKVATGFTVAHSITLSLCALNIFTLPSRFVEPMIALSIVVVAAERFVKPNDKVWRTVLIAFCFGLIHGFGFADKLREVGLPPGQAAFSLVSFNIGVELVQISLILVCIPILTLLSEKRPKVFQPASIACAVCISLIGLFWFGERILQKG